ncbi:inducible alternative oxidase 2 [Scheffersomyces spartinae]|uniref:Alternative oxidase n=1 Tax=Scheffersomyces spartinae TaxID=45513 RepID=A0A9P8AKR0_9ASCO|nr:inducible alternative oxidase 2 [Scheffersomyces spartinae]KAG7196083.1 inducible alternative oxidase 2 [Scheffersomyces spartinae]
MKTLTPHAAPVLVTPGLLLLCRYSSSLATPPVKEPIRSNILLTKILTQEESKKQNDEEFITHPMFKHPEFTDAECEGIHYEHRTPKTLGDRIAFRGIQTLRLTYDLVTGYKNVSSDAELEKLKGTRWEMTDNKWLTRVIFLESVAGVPGMVAAFIRHLHSLRLMKRDKAWIETLLDEAYNERMHLLTFIKIGRPSLLTRALLKIGQGVFANIFFFLYIVNPRYCHRFVGYLEEEAVSTYTHLAHELTIPGKLPELEKVKLPEIATTYWWELKEDSSFRDLILRIRADEAKHREVNHTLANLNQKTERNPFAMKDSRFDDPQPDYTLKNTRGTGWERLDLHL